MKIDGRSNDLTFSWMLTSLGPEWSEWQKLAAEWMSTQKEGVAPKQVSLTRFFESYLYKVAPYSANIELFFKGHNGHRCSTTEFEKNNKANSKPSSSNTKSNRSTQRIFRLRH